MLAAAETERFQRLEELTPRMRHGKALQEKRRVEWHAVDLAQASDQPDEIRLRDSPIVHRAPSPVDKATPNSAGAESPESFRTFSSRRSASPRGLAHRYLGTGVYTASRTLKRWT